MIDCVNCWGAGMYVEDYYPSPYTQERIKRHVKCYACNGTGKVPDPRV